MNDYEKFSEKAHKFQKYGDESYFEKHIKGVVGYLKSVFNLDEDTNTVAYATAYLHDTLEDCSDTVTVTDIVENFGRNIAECVIALTRNGDETYYDYIMRLINHGGKEENKKIILIVKMCDLMFNIKQTELMFEDTSKFTSNAIFKLKNRLDKYKLSKYILECHIG